MDNLSENGGWYVVHTYSGHENKVKANLEKMVENRGMQDVIYSVEVPIEKYTETKDGKVKEKERKKFPGYVIINMEMTDDSWYLVRNTRGVTGFVGPGSKPIPLSEEEVKNLGVQEEIKGVDVEIDEVIEIQSGPFNGLEGIIKEIDNEKGKIKATVSMFGRETIVELNFEQFKKIN